VHLEAVRSTLARGGVPESALRCPPVPPLDAESMIAAPERLPINSDCSGKHAGMLVAAREQGWALESYRSADHPLQLRVLEAVRAASGFDRPEIGVDGCGVAVHGIPLVAMATIYARLAVPERLGFLEPQARRAVAAMRAEPYMVAGRNRVDTTVMQSAPGVIVKSGAEGMLCAASLADGIGIAIKVRDGSHRAVGSALMRVLRLMELIDGDTLRALEPFEAPPVLGGGEPVGSMTSDFELTRT